MMQKSVPDARRPEQDNLQCECQRLRQEVSVALGRVEELEHKLAERNSHLHQLLASTSWRVTAPLRALVSLVKLLTNPPRLLSLLASRSIVLAARFPRLRGLAMRFLAHTPRLREAIRKRAMPQLVAGWSGEAKDYAHGMTVRRLPPSAAAIYRQLEMELSAQKPLL